MILCCSSTTIILLKKKKFRSGKKKNEFKLSLFMLFTSLYALSSNSSINPLSVVKKYFLLKIKIPQKNKEQQSLFTSKLSHPLRIL